MQTSEPLKGPAMVGELAKVARVLRDLESRKAFKGDPRGALNRAGVDMGAIPSSIIDTLSGMTPDQLEAIIRFNDAGVDGGLSVVAEGSGKPGGDRVAFF
jgi:hypothetical protein